MSYVVIFIGAAITIASAGIAGLRLSQFVAWPSKDWCVLCGLLVGIAMVARWVL